jgi:hypothetical protein
MFVDQGIVSIDLEPCDEIDAVSITYLARQNQCRLETREPKDVECEVYPIGAIHAFQ